MALPRYRVAFATYPAVPEITADDRLLADALAPRGVAVRGVPWDAPEDWTTFDLVLIRSTWDFHLRLPAFTDWLHRLDSKGVRLVNPARLVSWNVTKRYLQDLEARGVPVVPTHWITPPDDGRGESLASIAGTHDWHEGVVVKPVVSASAHDTWIARGADRAADDARLRESLSRASHGLMLQPFLPGIATRGEWSLVFIAGAYSHAVLKRPADGDFRVQNDFGGSAEAAEPPPTLIDDASRALDAAACATAHRPQDIAYARIDGVEEAGRLTLMELEAVEPVLFLGSAPGAAGRFAAALDEVLSTGTAGGSRPA